jgi:hypothetical protein
VLRRGLKVSVTCPAGKVDIRATLAKALIASGRVSCSGVGRTTTLTLAKTGRKRLKAARRPVLQLRAGTATASVSLR